MGSFRLASVSLPLARHVKTRAEVAQSTDDENKCHREKNIFTRRAYRRKQTYFYCRRVSRLITTIRIIVRLYRGRLRRRTTNIRMKVREAKARKTFHRIQRPSISIYFSQNFLRTKRLIPLILILSCLSDQN